MGIDEDPDKWVFVRVCVCLCMRLCVGGSVCMLSRVTTNDVNLVYGKGEWCDMCSSGIAWVRAGSRLFGRDIESVCERGVRASERERERGS